MVLIFGGMLLRVLQVVRRGPPRRLDVGSLGPAWLLLGTPLAAHALIGVWLPPFLSGPFAAVARVLAVAP